MVSAMGCGRRDANQHAVRRLRVKHKHSRGASTASTPAAAGWLFIKRYCTVLDSTLLQQVLGTVVDNRGRGVGGLVQQQEMIIIITSMYNAVENEQGRGG